MKYGFVLLPLCCWTSSPYIAIAGEKPPTVKTIEKKVTEMDVSMVAMVPAESIAGSEVNLKITVENQSKEDVIYYTQTKYWDYDLSLLNSKGEAVPLTRFGKMAYSNSRGDGSGAFLSLPAGKDMRVTLNLARVFDLTQEGEYSLSISRKLSGHLKTHKTFNLKIEKMTFTIVAENVKDR